MNTNEVKFSETDSLNVILSMIESAKGNVAHNSFYFLFWGWLVVICTLTELILSSVYELHESYYVWLAVIPGMIISYIHGYRSGKRRKVKSHVDKVIGFVWIAFLVNYIVLIFHLSKINFQITPLTLIFSASAVFVCGVALKEASMLIGSGVLWVAAFLAFFFKEDIQHVILIIGIVGGYLYPGYVIRHKYGKIEKQESDV